MSAPVRTLVVDDDVAVAGLHQGFLLAHGGFEVVGLAHTGAEALAQVATLRPELVLLDIDLPDVDGVEVLRRIRAEHPEPVAVIAITAAREAATVRAMLSGGVLHYLVKPFSSPVLHERLDDFLRQRVGVPDSGAALEQADIDRMLGVAPTPEPEPAEPSVALPKGLSRPTYDAVLAALRAAEDVSASEVATRVGASRVTVRRYLEHLVQNGRAALHLRYGASGRPEHRYRAR